MDWHTVYPLVQRMVGLHLSSISGRSNITLISIDNYAVTIQANSGVVTRKTAELRTIARAMRLDQPIHVDAFIHGSGSSRNQPETILANLPNVEWTRIDGRKHIVWVPDNSHALGTLREHD